MIFNSKQLEELENIHDSTGAFEEEGDDEAGFDEVGEAAMDWRRGLIEEAAENVKRAKTRPVEPHIQYPIGSMLFDREVRRFARVQRSVPGYLKIGYLSGDDREFGTLDVVGYLKDVGAEKRLSELSEQLGMLDIDVSAELERLGITPLDEPENPEVVAGAEGETAAAASTPPPSKATKKAAAPVAANEADDEESGPDVNDEEDGAAIAALPVGGKAPQKPQSSKPEPKPAAAKAPAKGPSKAAPSHASPPSGAAGASRKPGAATTAPAASAAGKKSTAAASGAGKGANPIDDPNGYIKAHFQEMSNRELARLTGLSEHTIRRKLGEWGLKRKKEG